MAYGTDDVWGGDMSCLVSRLQDSGIHVHTTSGIQFPLVAVMHDRAAHVPSLVISPHNEKSVIRTAELLSSVSRNYHQFTSLRSGGHGYFHSTSASKIMVNLGLMTGKCIVEDTLFVEPGCLLGHLINLLDRSNKAVPHGDCFGVAAGGHFTTAGWDMALARRYGLGCQSVIGGRIVLWDGKVLDVDESTHPRLLYALRGGAAASVGIVTQIRLQLIPQSPLVSWNFHSLSKSELEICVAYQAFKLSSTLPRDISISLRFYFDAQQIDPVCSFNIVSLLGTEDTLVHLEKHLGSAVTTLVSKKEKWRRDSLLRFRLIPASAELAAQPRILDEATSLTLHQNPLTYWNSSVAAREMAPSHFYSRSHWIRSDSDTMFLSVYENMRCLPPTLRSRAYVLAIQGGGCIIENQVRTSMPLGRWGMVRVEVHWDSNEDKARCGSWISEMSKDMKTAEDKGPDRIYRGDIHDIKQGEDAILQKIQAEYNGRSSVLT